MRLRGTDKGMFADGFRQPVQCHVESPAATEFSAAIHSMMGLTRNG